jgi:Txe/YoeB family toxin of toxin-antitoxin system
MYKLFYTKKALKDAKKLKLSNLHNKTQALLDIIRQAPYQTPPTYEKLTGDLSGAYSRRINIQHRLIYQVLEEEKSIKVIRMWTHYE